MTNNHTCRWCKHHQVFTALNVGPNEERKVFIKCNHEEASKSVRFPQADFSCRYQESLRKE